MTGPLLPVGTRVKAWFGDGRGDVDATVAGAPKQYAPGAISYPVQTPDGETRMCYDLTPIDEQGEVAAT